MPDMPTLAPPRQTALMPRHQDTEYVILTESNDRGQKNLLDYLSLIWRHKRLFFLPLICIMPFVWFYVGTQAPSYSATATVSIEDTNPKVLPIPEVQAPDRSPNFYSTQYEILKSRAIAEDVVNKLQLDAVPPAQALTVEVPAFHTLKDFPGRVWQAVMAMVAPSAHDAPVPAATPEAAAEAAADQRRQRAVGRLLKGLTIEPRKGTKLVDIILVGDDPVKVALQVNTIAATYAGQNLEKRLEASRKASIWLQKEAENLRIKIADGERKLQTLKEDKRLVTSEVSNASSTELNGLGALNVSFMDKRRERLALRAELDELRKFLTAPDLSQGAQYPSLLNNATISSLRTRYINMQVQHTELAKKFMDKHPKMVSLSTEMAEVRKAITDEVKRVITSLENQYNTLTAQENNLQQLLNTQKNTVIRSEKDLMAYETLRRDLDVHKAMYLEISKRFAETTLTTALETNNVTVVEKALSGSLVPSKAPLQLFLGFVLSLVGGGALALLAEVLDKRFKNVAEVEQSLALPFLGFIPHYDLFRRRFPALITLQKPWSDAAESYRTLRTWIQLVKPSVQSVLITSAAAGEGKSTTAANLAVSFAQLGQRVLLVDADLRKPSLPRIFGGSTKYGLTDVLVNGMEWQEVIHETPMDNLKVLFAGTCHLNPAELLNMARLHHLLEHWKSCFDRIIIDSPVVLSIPDVMILAPEIDGVLLVHAQEHSTRTKAIEAKRLLERARARMLGVIFNNVDVKDMQYYASYKDSSRYGGPNILGNATEYMTEHAVAPAIEAQATNISTSQKPSVPVSTPAAPIPLVVQRDGRSHGIHITLHTVTLCHNIGTQYAARGRVFLIIDLEITNDGTFGHLFDPMLAALNVREETDYGHALASLIPISGARDDTATLHAARSLNYYDPALTAQVNGFASVVDIATDHTSRGLLVYNVLEAHVSYAFVYTNTPVVLDIPFTIPT